MLALQAVIPAGPAHCARLAGPAGESSAADGSGAAIARAGFAARAPAIHPRLARSFPGHSPPRHCCGGYSLAVGDERGAVLDRDPGSGGRRDRAGFIPGAPSNARIFTQGKAGSAAGSHCRRICRLPAAAFSLGYVRPVLVPGAALFFVWGRAGLCGNGPAVDDRTARRSVIACSHRREHGAAGRSAERCRHSPRLSYGDGPAPGHLACRCPRLQRFCRLSGGTFLKPSPCRLLPPPSVTFFRFPRQSLRGPLTHYARTMHYAGTKRLAATSPAAPERGYSRQRRPPHPNGVPVAPLAPAPSREMSIAQILVGNYLGLQGGRPFAHPRRAYPAASQKAWTAGS